VSLTDNEQAALEELIWVNSSLRSCKQIAKRLGISKQRVEQIERVALLKLKKNARGKASDWELEPRQSRKGAVT